MANDPQYSVFQIDLTNAGSQVVSQQAGVIRLVNAENSSGGLVLTAKANVKLGVTDKVGMPLRLGQAVLYSSSREVTITWDAQSGVIATFFMSADPSRVDMDARPPAQLTTASVSGTASSGADVSIAAGVQGTIAANANRAELLLQCDQDIRVGGSTTDATHGAFVPAGTPFVLTTTAEITIHNLGASAATVTYCELDV